MTSRSFRVVGLGRAGGSFAEALSAAGWQLDAVFGRAAPLDSAAVGVDVVIVSTPDRAIAEVARAIRPVADTVIVHLAGACGLDVLAPHARRASVHALMTLPDAKTGAERLRGGWFAIAGDDIATELVEALHGRSFVVDDDQRAMYHAAAAVASNHLVVLLGQVERLAASAGVPFEAFLPLIRASVDNVEAFGAARALTGPAARGDDETIERHLRAVDESERPLYRMLSNAARTLASSETEPREDGVTTIVRSIADLRAVLAEARLARGEVGFVPTMGYLHDGHRSLMAAAAADSDITVVSVFVNPLQFAPTEDLDRYPRDLERDVQMASDEGVRYVFAPTQSEMYPERIMTTVSVAGVSEPLEGASRPSHFAGVATVVAKLFAIVGPCRAYFGEKDFQQLAVIRKLASDLSMPIEVVACPTIREADGLAMSSRNVNLTPDARRAAPSLLRALQAGRQAIERGERDAAEVRRAMREVVEREPLIDLDYAEVVDASTFVIPTPLAGTLRLLIAARLPNARLIDNVGAEAS